MNGSAVAVMGIDRFTRSRSYSNTRIKLYKKRIAVVPLATEPNRRKCRVWNSHGHVITLPVETEKFRRFSFSLRVEAAERRERYTLRQKCLKK